MIKFYRVTVAVFVGLFLAVFGVWRYSAYSAPLLANYYLGQLSEQTDLIKSLSKNDVLILVPTQILHHPLAITKIRALNPDIIILAYVPSQSYNVNYWDKDPIFGKLNPIDNNLWLRDSTGAIVYAWPGIKNTNLSPQWSRNLVNFIKQDILILPGVDGVFFDMVSGNISWANNGDVDLDGDGKRDLPAVADALWLERTRYLLEYARANLNTDYVVINGASNGIFQQYVNGRMYENYPTPWEANGSWNGIMNDLTRLQNGNIKPQLYLFNSNTDNSGRRENYRNMRFGLASSLMVDNVYFSFDYGDKDHGQTWQYDEYNVNLGTPVNAGRAIGGGNDFTASDVYRRDYDNGLALVNPTADVRAVDLGGEYEKIIGTQDKGVNSGGIVSKVNLPARDGLILRKTFQEVNNVFFLNGGMVRFFTSAGARARNGFFAFASGFAGGAQIFQGDLDGVVGVEKIVSENGRLRIFDNVGRIWQDSEPLFENAPSRLNLAVGRLEADKGNRLVITGEKGGAVLLATYYGAPFSELKYPLGKKYQSGFSVAIGDVDGGDGDVVFGTGRGSVGEVIIMDKYLVKIKKRFYPYGRGFKNGVAVGAGDVLGDGRAEILTVGKVSDKIIVKIFNAGGQKLKEFSAGMALGATRFNVGVADVDGDGRVEVVVGSE